MDFVFKGIIIDNNIGFVNFFITELVVIFGLLIL